LLQPGTTPTMFFTASFRT